MENLTLFATGLQQANLLLVADQSTVIPVLPLYINLYFRLSVHADWGRSENKTASIGDYKAFHNPFSYGTTVKQDGSSCSMWFRTFMMSIKGHKSTILL